jgi:hypothetical protein
MSQFALGRLRVAGAPGEKAKMQSRHGEGRIEVGGDSIMLAGAVPITVSFAAKCQDVVGTGIQFVDHDQAPAGDLGRGELTGVRE